MESQTLDPKPQTLNRAQWYLVVDGIPHVHVLVNFAIGVEEVGARPRESDALPSSTGLSMIALKA